MSPDAEPLVAEPEVPGPRPERLPLVRRIAKLILGPYLRLYHGLEMHGFENVPPGGPVLVIVNHASLLDVPVLMVIDPFPNTATIVKASLFKVPLVSWLLKNWGAIPVERQGRDSSSVRAMLGVLRSGGVMAVAGEGRRTRSGHLETINPVLARIAVSANVPLLAVGISGTFNALPPGQWIPRPRKIVVRVGKPFRFQRGTDPAVAAERIRHELAILLPPEMQPLESATRAAI